MGERFIPRHRQTRAITKYRNYESFMGGGTCAPATTKLKRGRGAVRFKKAGPARNGVPFTAAPIIDHWNADECLLTLARKRGINTELRAAPRASPRSIPRPDRGGRTARSTPRCTVHLPGVYPSTEALRLRATNNFCRRERDLPRPRAGSTYANNGRFYKWIKVFNGGNEVEGPWNFVETETGK